MKSSGTLWLYAYIMVFLYCSWPMTLCYLPLPRPNGTTRASTPWRWKTPLAWKHQPSMSTSLVSWQIFFLSFYGQVSVSYSSLHTSETQQGPQCSRSQHTREIHMHTTHQLRVTIGDPHTCQPVQFTGRKHSFFHYLEGGIWPYWKMDKIIFMRFCCCFKLSKKFEKLEQLTHVHCTLYTPNVHWLA